MLEGKLGLVIDEAAGHHQVAGHPLGALRLQGLDLVPGGAVQFLARDILIDLGRAFTVRTVGAAKVGGVGNAGRALLLAVAAKAAGAGVGTVTAIEAARCPFLPVPERLAVLAAETASVTFALTTGTVTKRLTVTVAERLTVTVAGTAAKTAAVTFAVTARTVTKRLTVAVAELPTLTTGAATLAVTARTVTKRLTVTVAELPTLTTGAATLAVTARTVTKRLTITITKRLTVTITELPTLTASASTLAITARTVTKRLTITITKRLPLTAAGRATTRGAVAVAVRPRPESAGIPAGIVVAAERATVITAVAAVVLGHMDSSCCEPPLAQLQPLVSFPTQPEIKRFEVRTSSSILVEPPNLPGQRDPWQRYRGHLHSRRPRRSCLGFCVALSGVVLIWWV
ncbi:hypothetical protein [Arthrobacter sp. B1I2]|uniref:hypothetical protein n=1 Tax=Arthrobacter sp. B1I2 TaxID=3042263 RepID=UPI0027D8931E|nr:hypothetical protein [Arthrobacter sp. B1I2]